MSLEFGTLSKCAPKLEIGMKSHLHEMAHYLYSNGFITHDIQEELLDPKSKYSDAQKATMMVCKIRNNVKIDPSNYYKLLNHLRQDERKYKAIVEILDSEYFGIRKLQLHSASSGSSEGLNPKTLRDELSEIKDKWFNIGLSLNIKKELLQLFDGLSDPLFEVVIHWWNGVESMITWNAVVSALRDPVIQATEVAERIERIYCAPTSVDTELKADSEITEGVEKVKLKGNYQLFENQNESEELMLKKETSKIKIEFANFCEELLQHLLDLQRIGTITLSAIQVKINIFDRKLTDKINSCRSLEEVFGIVCSESSFYDYDLLKLLADTGDEKLQRKFIDYKKNLQAFFEGRLLEKTSANGEKSYEVIIDDSIMDEIDDWINLQNRVKFILGHKDITLERLECMNQSKPIVTGISETLPSTSHGINASTVIAGAGTTTATSLSGDVDLLTSQISALPSESSSSTKLSTANISKADAVQNQKIVVTLSQSDDHEIENVSCSQNSQIMTFSEDVLQSDISIGNYSQSDLQSLPKVGLLKESCIEEYDLDDEYIKMTENARDLSSKSPLHIKAGEGDLSGVIEMVANGHNIMDKDENGNAAPHYAARNGHFEHSEIFHK